MKNHASAYIICLFLYTLSGFGQVVLKGKVVDARSGEVIPYANIYLKSFTDGTTSFRNGNFRLKIDTSYKDTVMVSCMGFKTGKYPTAGLIIEDSVQFRLVPDVNLLDEVQVKPGNMIMETLGFYKRKPEDCAGILAQMPRARFIPNNKGQNGYVKSVSVFVCKKGIFDAPFRINIQRVDSLRTPGEGLIKEDYILSASEGGSWVTLDLSKKNIAFPEDGFFVVIQPLPIDTSHAEYYIETYKLSYPQQMYTDAPLFGHAMENVEEGYNLSLGFAQRSLISMGKTKEGWYRIYGDVYEMCKTDKQRRQTSISNLMVSVEVEVYEQ